MDDDRQGCCWDEDWAGVEMRMVMVRDEDGGGAE
jgi:hypothetical protein